MAGDANCSTRMKTYSIAGVAILGKTNLVFAFAMYVCEQNLATYFQQY